jgi:hypothetical protein
VIDLTANPLPAGVYFVDIVVQINGCQVLVNSLFVKCPTGGEDAYNIDCCIGQITGAAHADQQNNPPVVYTYHFNTPLTQDIIIDLDTAQIVDKLSVYSDWNNTLLTGTEIATTGYIGHCGECCNTQYHPYTVGYFERNYNGVTPTPPVDSPHRTCNNGTYTGGTTPVPGGFSYGGYLDSGKARLVLTPTYVNSLGLVDNILYIVMYNNGTANTYDEFGNLTCSCNTVWSFRVKCDDNCPCGETQAPEIVILPKICEVSSGELTIVTPCLSLTGHMQWSLDGITWVEGEPMYIALPGITGITQTLYTRCISDTDYSCYSDITQTHFSKPDCCSGLLDFTVECNPITEGLYNQTAYRYRVIYYIPSCDDTENPNVVSPLYGSPEDNDYQYIVGFNDNAVTVEVYFNETSPYFFSIVCNLCQTPMYWVSNNDAIQDAISNLLITHACEPCDIVLEARYDYHATAYYISLDNVGGTQNLPAIPVGQPPYTLTITKNNVLVGTADGVYIWYNRSVGCLPPTKTYVPHNLAHEYIIDKYKPCTGLIENTEWNYGFFINVANPGQYVINITDHDNCVVSTTVCNIDTVIESCVANVAYAKTTKGVVGDTFNSITVDGIVFTPVGITYNVDDTITTAAILNYLNTSVVPTTGGSYQVVITSVPGFPLKRRTIIAYFNCDPIISLEYSTGIQLPNISVPYFPLDPIVYTQWSVVVDPAFVITDYVWTVTAPMTIVAGTTTSDIIITSGGGFITVLATTAECGQHGSGICNPEADIISCAVEEILTGSVNCEDYFFKGVVVNGTTFSSANIQIVDSGVTAAAVIEANILAFINANVVPNTGGVFSVEIINVLGNPFECNILWIACEGNITSIQTLFNLPDNITAANSAINSTSAASDGLQLSVAVVPNYPITSYLWSLTGLTLLYGSLTDLSIIVDGGGTADITIDVEVCGITTGTNCYVEVNSFDVVCNTIEFVASESLHVAELDKFEGVIIGGVTFTAVIATIFSSITQPGVNIASSIAAWLNVNVAPTVGGYFTAEVNNVLPAPFGVKVTWSACTADITDITIIMTNGGIPYYGTFGNTPIVIPNSQLIEAAVLPVGTLEDDEWAATGLTTVDYVLSQTEAYVTYGGAGTLTYSVEVVGCGTNELTTIQV